MSELVVGVDVGTQSVRAGLYATDGACLGDATVPLALHRRGGDIVEQDPEGFTAATTQAIAACVRTARCGPGAVAGIAVAAQMAGILGIGDGGLAVTPYDSWLDTRSRGEVDWIASRLGADVLRLTGCPPMIAHAPKIRWWQHQRPAVYAHVRRFVVPSAFVAGRLSGLSAAESYIDWTHLHFTGAADAASGQWSPALVSALDIDPGRLPRIVAPTTVVGGLTTAAAAACGLAPNTPIAAGLGDTAAGTLGAGVVRAGQILDTAGTASVLGISTARFRPDLGARTLVAMRAASPGQWVALAYLAGGDLVRWLPHVLAGRPAGDALALAALLAEAEGARPARLLFVPHLAGRLLPAAPHARGGWVAPDLATGRGDLVRSVLESVAFEYAGFLARARVLHPELELREVRVIGGGSRNRLWNRIKATVLKLPYVRLEPRAFTTWGAALVAAAAVGLVHDLEGAALGAAATAERVDPDPQLLTRYADRLADYRAALEVLASPAPATSAVTA